MRQVCFAIVGKTKMHMSEMCICEDAECLSDELAMAKEDFPEEDFQIVPLFTRRHLTPRAEDVDYCNCPDYLPNFILGTQDWCLKCDRPHR